MKQEEIPTKCRDCIYMRAWSLHMDGNHEYDCRKKPSSMVGSPDCDCYESVKREGEG